MEPGIWLYRKDFTTVRVVERPAERGVEVFVFGIERVPKRHAFDTPVAAAQFRATLESDLLAQGFELRWGDGRRRGS
jgi:hypothetical protein